MNVSEMAVLKAIYVARGDAFPQGITLQSLRDHYLPTARLQDLCALESAGLTIQIGAWWEITKAGREKLNAALPALELPPLILSVQLATVHGAAIIARRRYGVDSAQFRQQQALADGLARLLKLDGVQS